MAYRLASLRLAAAMGAVLVGPMAPASASCGWGGWFGQERPVIYRPVVTPQTYYFAPAASTEVIPAPVIRRVHPHRHRHHRPYR